MNRIIVVFIITLLIYSCGCEDRDGVINNFEFTDFESTIISTDLNQENEFTNQMSDILAAQYSEIDSLPNTTPLNRDDCSVNYFDSKTITLSFNDEEFLFEIVINKNIQNLTSFIILVNNERFLLNGAEFESNISEEDLTDYTINGFIFNNIFIFNGESETGINKIIYSINKGIEFIEFDNGNYFKLNES